jgi:hypothetical protein
LIVRSLLSFVIVRFWLTLRFSPTSI